MWLTLPSASAYEALGKLFGSHILRMAHLSLCYQGQLHCVERGDRNSSLDLMPTGPALLTIVGGKWGRRGEGQHHPITSQQVSGRASSPGFLASGWLTCAPSTRASSTVLPRQGTGSALLSAAAIEGQGQLTLSFGPRARFPTCNRW